jgi:hypothetical protein
MSDVTRSASPSITTVVRGIARILSAVILLFWSFIIIAHLVGDEGRFSRSLAFPGALILLAASLFLLCWRLSGTQTQRQH